MRVSAGTRIGPYEVLGLLGAGGMGEVYRGRDSRLQRSVAIKVITANVSDPDVIRRFESEALSASALNHPNILTVYEFGVHEGLHYLVTELIEGETLRDRLRAGRLPIAEALEVAVQVAAALDAAHASGLVHRDVKPENVMLRPDGYVKVLDFGLAKLASTPEAAAENMTISLRTTPGTMLGTVGYMAPEQVRGLDVDQRADVWSIGVVLHETISGRSPFAGPTSGDVIASVLERQPPPLTTDGMAVPPELERIVSKALAKKRDERYQTIKDLLIDLRRLKQQLDRDAEVDGSPGPTPLGPAPRTDSGERRPWPAVTAALLVALLVLGTVGWRLWRLTGQSASSGSVAALPQRTLAYSLTVQRVRDGKPYQDPFESSGQQEFEHGSRFRFTFLSAEPGFLYLINQGVPGAQGGGSLRMLYPTPSIRAGSAAVPGGEPVETGWYRFGENQGTEAVWIVFSVRQVHEMERAKRLVNPRDLGLVRDREETATIQRLLATFATNVNASEDPSTKRMRIESRGEALASRADLVLK